MSQDELESTPSQHFSVRIAKIFLFMLAFPGLVDTMWDQPEVSCLGTISSLIKRSVEWCKCLTTPATATINRA